MFRRTNIRPVKNGLNCIQADLLVVVLLVDIFWLDLPVLFLALCTAFFLFLECHCLNKVA